MHFAAETHVDRSIKNAGEFITTDVYGTFVLLEAARENPALRRFVQISTDEVYGSVPEGSSTRDRRAAAAQSLLGEQGRRRPAGLQLLGDLRGAGHHHPRLEQLRAEPVSREDHSALHHQPDRRHPGAALRRRAERARLAARRRSLPRRGPADREGRGRRGLQHRRRQRGEERRPHAPDPRAGRQADVADQAGRRIGRATTAAIRSTRQAQVARLAAARTRSSRGSPRPSRGTARTSGGGGRSRTRTPEFQQVLPGASTATAPDACRWLAFRSSPARPASRAATCSSGSSRRASRCTPGRTRGSARRTAGATAAVTWNAVDLLDRAAVRAALGDRPSLGHLSLRRARRSSRTRGARRRARCASTSSARTTCSRRRASSGSSCRVLVTGSALVYRPQRGRDRPRTIRSVRRTRTASASWRRR